MRRNSLLLPIGVALAFSACVTRKYAPPQAPEAATFRGDAGTDTSSIASIAWKDYFPDAQLQALIQQALDSNLDLKIAVARIKYAEAGFRQSKAAFFPSATVDADYTLNKSSLIQARQFDPRATSTSTVEQYALTASTSWEADIWGKLRKSRKAALAALLASEAYQRSIQTEVVAAVANNYYALLAYDEQLRIAERTIDIRRSDTATMHALKTYAVVTGADVEQSEANLYAAEIQAETIRQGIRETENTISVLLGRMPDSIPRGTLQAQSITSDLRTGVPVQLLSNRPDVQQAEMNFRNAFELTNVARTYFYPSLTLTGTGGWAVAGTLTGFFDGTFYGSLFAGLTQPLFNQGLNRQRLRQAQATQEEALYTFKATVITAGQEVADALYSYHNATRVNASRVKQVASLEKAVDYTKELLKYTSNVNYTDVLTAETNLLNAELGGVSDKLRQLQSSVDLYRALGGGWR